MKKLKIIAAIECGSVEVCTISTVLTDMPKTSTKTYFGSVEDKPVRAGVYIYGLSDEVLSAHNLVPDDILTTEGDGENISYFA